MPNMIIPAPAGSTIIIYAEKSEHEIVAVVLDMNDRLVSLAIRTNGQPPVPVTPGKTCIMWGR